MEIIKPVIKPARNDEPEDMDETIPMPAFGPINEEGSVFDTDAKKKFSGLNSRPSVFDQSAVFHVGSSEPDTD
jgi:hypothetical protein